MQRRWRNGRKRGRESGSRAGGLRFNEQQTRCFERILRAIASLFQFRFSNGRPNQRSLQSRNCVPPDSEISHRFFSLSLSLFFALSLYPTMWQDREITHAANYNLDRTRRFMLGRGGSLAKYSCSERDDDNGAIRSRREKERTARGDKRVHF